MAALILDSPFNKLHIAETGFWKMDSVFNVYERLYYATAGEYCYLSNKSGSRQGLFSRTVSAVIDIVNETGRASLSEISEKLGIEKGGESEASLRRVLEDISSAGFFSPPPAEPEYHSLDPQIRERLNTAFARDPVPFTVDFELTSKCNLRCVHCYNSCTNEDRFLPLDDFEQMIRELKSLGTLFVGLSGGEPLLHPQLRQIIELCDHYGMLVTVLTNGTLLSDEFISFVRAKSVQVLKISFYSSEAKEHDAITTRSGSFELTRRNILKYSKQFPIVLQCPVMHLNRAAVPALRAWAKSNGVPINFSLSIIAKSDLSGSNLHTRLSLEEYRSCREELGISGVTRQFQEDDERQLCFGGISSLAISVEGDRFICPLFKLKLNEEGESLTETWSSSPLLKKIRSIRRSDFPRCGSCVHRNACRVCLAENYNETGDMMVIPDYTCQKRNV